MALPVPAGTAMPPSTSMTTSAAPASGKPR